MNTVSIEPSNTRSDQERRKTQAPEFLRSRLLESKVKSHEDQQAKTQKDNEEKICELQRALEDQKRTIAVIQQHIATRGRAREVSWASSQDGNLNTQLKRTASPDLTSNNKRTRVDSYIPPRLLSTQGADRYTPSYSDTGDRGQRPAPTPTTPSAPAYPKPGFSQGVSTARPAFDISLRQAFARAKQMGT